MEAIDRDAGENGRVSYTILSGNLNDTFDIDRSTGALFTSREVSGRESAPVILRIHGMFAGVLALRYQ